MQLINRVITGGYWGAYYLVYVVGMVYLAYHFRRELRFPEAGQPDVDTLFVAAAICGVSAGTALFVAIIVEVTGRMVLLIPRAWNKAKDIGRAEGLAAGLTEGRAAKVSPKAVPRASPKAVPRNGTGCRPSCPSMRGATRKPGASSWTWTGTPRNACVTATARNRAGPGFVCPPPRRVPLGWFGAVHHAGKSRK